eukprot:scaffold199938_cov18-Tisochrysis_lutea.AAC.1
MLVLQEGPMARSLRCIRPPDQGLNGYYIALGGGQRRSDAQPAIGAGPFAGRLFNALCFSGIRADKMAGSRLRRRPWMLLGWEPVGGAYGSFFEVHQDLYFIHILQEEHMALSLSFGMPGIFDQVKDEANDRFMIEKRSSL